MLGLLSRFDRHRNECLEKAADIYGQRGLQYNRDVDIRDYWIYGAASLMHIVWGKILRLKSIINARMVVKGDAHDDAAFEDSIVDAINYLTFMYAENKCRKEDALPKGTTLEIELRRRIDEHAETRDTTQGSAKGPTSRKVPVTTGDDVGHVLVRPKPGSLHHVWCAGLASGVGCTCGIPVERAYPDTGKRDDGVADVEHPPQSARSNRSDSPGSLLRTDDEGYEPR